MTLVTPFAWLSCVQYSVRITQCVRTKRLIGTVTFFALEVIRFHPYATQVYRTRTTTRTASVCVCVGGGRRGGGVGPEAEYLDLNLQEVETWEKLHNGKRRNVHAYSAPPWITTTHQNTIQPCFRKHECTKWGRKRHQRGIHGKGFCFRDKGSGKSTK